MEKVSLRIDGKQIACPPGTSILRAAQAHGINIPTLCHHPDLKPYGACRLCLVEDEKSGRLMASCVSPALPDMSLRTESARLKKHRTNIVRLMMAEHPESCVVCNKGNRCRLRETAAQLGVGQTDLYPMPNFKPLEQANPFIVRDLSKCILCGMCIRADHELVGVGAIDYHLRGFRSRPTTVHDYGLERSSCTFCGTCVSICPTGALGAKESRYIGTPERGTDSICGFCGVGCAIHMGLAEDRMVEINPSQRRGTVNGATLCVRGHFAHDFLNVEKRLVSPMLRENGAITSASWDEALERAAAGFLEIKKTNGPQSVAFLGSSKCTNEENYLFQKIARTLLDTNNVDNGGYLSGRAVANLIDRRLDGGGRRRPLSAIEQAEIIFVSGADPCHSAPVASYYIKRAVRKGVPLIVADPRKTELDAFSSLRLDVLPDGDTALINGLAALLFERNAHDQVFIDRFTEGFELYRSSLTRLDPANVCRVTGIDRGVMEQAADLLEKKRIVFVVGRGILQQRHGAAAVEGLLNLLLMTGSLGNEGGGLYIPAKENNETGAWDMGAVPDALPGRQSLTDEAARRNWERIWQTKLSPDAGLNVVRMIEEAEKGNLKALYILGENPLRSLPQSGRVRRALENLEFLVVEDILETETTEIAHIVLPGAAFSEKGGSFTNMEGRIQSFSPAAAPPGEAKPDWEVLDLLAQMMGSPKRYGSLEKIRTEISRSVYMYGERGWAEDAGWIMEQSHRKLFRSDGIGTVIPFVPVSLPESEAKPEDALLTAIMGSRRFHLGSGTRTGHSERIGAFDGGGEIEISPQDAAELDLNAGDIIRVSSEHGSLVREIRLARGLRPGIIFVPTACSGNDAMNLVDLTPLGEADSPGWKTCRVRLERV